jgi:DNA-binding transcriptional MerR regulator
VTWPRPALPRVAEPAAPRAGAGRGGSQPGVFPGHTGRGRQPDPSIGPPAGWNAPPQSGRSSSRIPKPTVAAAGLGLHKHLESLALYRNLRVDCGNTLTKRTACRADVAPWFEAARTDQPAMATGPRMNTGTLFDPIGRADADIVWIDVEPSARSAETGEITTRQMCERFNLPARTLRFYASKGLLAPIRRGRERLYNPLDQLHLAFILKGRSLGFTLDEIAQMIALREGRGSASVQRALQQNTSAGNPTREDDGYSRRTALPARVVLKPRAPRRGRPVTFRRSTMLATPEIDSCRIFDVMRRERAASIDQRRRSFLMVRMWICIG